MESLKNNAPENPENKSEQQSGKQKLEQILQPFGTDAAREAFIENCKNYIEARTRAVHESYSPDAAIRRRAITSGPKQAVIHNTIMDTLTRLAAQSLNISPIQQEILREMHNRDVTADYIKEYVASVDKTIPNEDEEEEGHRKKGMSDTAYYHSLGKGY